MQDNTGKVVLGLLGMVALWIAVYWWWPVSPPVSFAQTQAVPRGEAVRPVMPSIAEHTQQPPATPREPAPMLAQHTPPPPTAPPAAQPGVIAPVFIQHTIGVGETVESISKSYYGTGAYAGAILAANPTKNPPDLRAGRVINVPQDPRNVQGIPVASAPDPESEPGASEYVVQKGDVLGKVSQKVYGSTRHANLIFEANKDTMKNANSLRTGQRLRIPALPKGQAGGGGNGGGN